MMRSSRVLGLGLIALTTIVTVNCAEPVEDIDRSQPNKVKKETFDGEWYFRQTVVHVNGTAMSSFTGLEGDQERIVFQITENALTGRRAFEDIPGIDQSPKHIPQDIADEREFRPEDGSPIVSFPIQKHFDVIRSYNTSTGEQSNVIVENSMDRPWFERDYIRLGWDSQNQALIGAVGNLIRRYGAYATVEPPQDSTEEPTWIMECQRKGSEEFVECSDADAEVTYIDVLHTYYAKHSWGDCVNNFFSVPSVFYADCGSERIRMRSSFAKIRSLDVHGECRNCDQTWALENDYQPRAYNDYDDKRFGFFRMNRALYDRRWGLRDSNVRQLAQIRSIWQRYTDGRGNLLPHHEREPKPIAYYVNIDHPYDLLDEMSMISDDYDMAFKRIIFALSNADSEKAGFGKKYATIDDVPRMFFICSNPGPEPGLSESAPQSEIDRLTRLGEYFARDIDRFRAFYEQSNEGYRVGACKRPGHEKKMGDVRWSFFNFINEENQAGPLGYGPSSPDPITGELINGTSNAYGSAIDSYAQYLLDIINIINGDRDATDVGFGRNVQNYFDDVRAQYQAGASNMTVTSQTPAIMSETELSEAAAQVVQKQEYHEMMRRVAERKLQDPRVSSILERGPEALLLRNDFQRNPLNQFKGTAIEQKVIFPELIQAAELGQLGLMNNDTDEPPATTVEVDTMDTNVLDKISPLRGMSVRKLNEATLNRDLRNLKNRIHMAEDHFDAKFIGWARQGADIRDSLKARGLSDAEIQEALWLWVRSKGYLGLQEHEVGHSLGLRHNFAGSRDALNYFPQYWALRQQSFLPDCGGAKGYSTFAATGLATQSVAPGTCEQFASPEDHAQVFRDMLEGRDRNRNIQFDGGLETFATASIMEYGARFGLNDQAGLAMYDYAALAYAYGDLVEVFNQPPNKLDVQVKTNRNDAFLSTEWGKSNQLVTDMDDVENYTQVVVETDNTEIRRIEDTPIEEDRQRFGFFGFRDNKWDYYHYSVLPVMFYDENMEQPSQEQVNNLHLSPRIDFSGIGGMWKIYDRTLMPREQAIAEKKVMVPYKYCEDYFADQSSYDCMRWDTGSDDLEVLNTIIDRYNSYHVVNDFRRGRLTFGLYYSFGRLVNRVFLRALRAYQWWLLKASGRGVEWYAEEFGGIASTTAGAQAVSFLGSIINKPAIGTYAYSNEQGMMINYDSEGQGVGAGALSQEDERDLNRGAGSVFKMDLSTGARYQYTTFVERDDGNRPYYFPFMTQVFSHFFHKLFAMQVLVEGSIDALGTDSASNNQSFFIQPTIVFQDEIFNFFSGIVNEDYQRYVGVCVKTDDNGNVLTRSDNDLRPQFWKPILLTHSLMEEPCKEYGGENWQLVNPYTRAFGNADFNMRYFAILLGAQAFLGNIDYDWIDTAGLYVKGRGETPELSEELAGKFEAVEYTDSLGISNGITFMAYCPPGYMPGMTQEPRTGCDMVYRMKNAHDSLQQRRIADALADNNLEPADVGEDPLNPANPEKVDQVLAMFYSVFNYNEFRDLTGTHDMARFHLEILKRVW